VTGARTGGGGTRELPPPYLFPRLAATGNYSRIGIAQVHFDAAGIPVGLGQMGLALKPQTPYELKPQTGWGVEQQGRQLWYGLCNGHRQHHTTGSADP
jgi:hypothetical protein